MPLPGRVRACKAPSCLPMRGPVSSPGRGLERDTQTCWLCSWWAAARGPAGSWQCDFKLVQTPLWSLFFNLEMKYSNSCLIRFLGQTILWGPCVFWTVPENKQTARSLPSPQPITQPALHPERSIGLKNHPDRKLPPFPHYSCSNRFPHPSLCTGHAPHLKCPSHIT